MVFWLAGLMLLGGGAVLLLCAGILVYSIIMSVYDWMVK
jgi:hypothetical protein